MRSGSRDCPTGHTQTSPCAELDVRSFKFCVALRTLDSAATFSPSGAQCVLIAKADQITVHMRPHRPLPERACRRRGFRWLRNPRRSQKLQQRAGTRMARWCRVARTRRGARSRRMVKRRSAGRGEPLVVLRRNRDAGPGDAIEIALPGAPTDPDTTRSRRWCGCRAGSDGHRADARDSYLDDASSVARPSRGVLVRLRRSGRLSR